MNVCGASTGACTRHLSAEHISGDCQYYDIGDVDDEVEVDHKLEFKTIPSFPARFSDCAEILHDNSKGVAQANAAVQSHCYRHAANVVATRRLS